MLTTGRAPLWTMWLILGTVWLTGGCAARSAEQVSSDSVAIVEGEGRLDVRVPRAGRVWVFDVAESRLVWSGAVAPRARVMIVPEMSVVSVNDQQVVTRGLRPDATHRVFFQAR